MMSMAFQKRLFPLLPELRQVFGTPFHIYDEQGIWDTCHRLKEGFRRERINFREYFAVKALPNPTILRLLASQGFGFDCSSQYELQLTRGLGARGDDVMFTSNNTSQADFNMLLDPKYGEHIMNLDDITLIDKVPQPFPETVCFRYNPGKRRTGNSIIGKPEEAKYGVTHEQFVRAYQMAQHRGAKEFGIHTMICSNELNWRYMVETVRMLLELCDLLWSKLRIRPSFINMGGGLGIRYHPDQNDFNLEAMIRAIGKMMRDYARKNGGYMPKLLMESGRFITGPHGALVTTVINQKHTYREYRGVDACMSSLMRPGMYGAYHHIYVLDENGRLKRGPSEVVDVVGQLCENNDKFAVQRLLKKMVEGHFVVIANTGAHGIAMCFQYNGQPRPKELLLNRKGEVELIGRQEAFEDLYARYIHDPVIHVPSVFL